MLSDAKRQEALQWPSGQKTSLQPPEVPPDEILNSIASLGETLAAEQLLRDGYAILERNWRSGRYGEIDIIAISPDGLFCFIEVKTRKRHDPRFGIMDCGFNNINHRKQRKIINCALSYLHQTCRHPDAPSRLDAMLVLFDHVSKINGKKELRDAEILHVRGAFTPF